MSPVQGLHYVKKKLKICLGYRHPEHLLLASYDLGIFLQNLRLTFQYGGAHMTLFLLISGNKGGVNLSERVS